MDRKNTWTGRTNGQEERMDRKNTWTGRTHGQEEHMDRKNAWTGRKHGRSAGVGCLRCSRRARALRLLPTAPLHAACRLGRDPPPGPCAGLGLGPRTAFDGPPHATPVTRPSVCAADALLVNFHGVAELEARSIAEAEQPAPPSPAAGLRRPPSRAGDRVGLLSPSLLSCHWTVRTDWARRGTSAADPADSPGMTRK